MIIYPLCRLLLRLTHNEHWEGVRDNTPNLCACVFIVLCVFNCACVNVWLCVLFLSLEMCAEICRYVYTPLLSVCLSCCCPPAWWSEHTHTHTHTHTHLSSSFSLRGLPAYYESLVGEGGENKRPTTFKWQQTAETERFTSLIPAHRDLKELSM